MSRDIKFRAWDKNKKSMFDPNNSIQTFGWYAAGKSPEIDLMQYTGLKDKNGVDICEGDKVYCRDQNGYVVGVADEVFYNEDAGCFWLKRRDIPMYKWVQFFEECGTLDVIGNIHQNPDLLK